MKKSASIYTLIAVVCMLNNSIVLAEATLYERLKETSKIEYKKLRETVKLESQKDHLAHKEIESSSLMEAVEKDSTTFSDLSPEVRIALFKQHPLRVMRVMGQRVALTSEVSLLAVCKSMSYNGLDYLFALVETEKVLAEDKESTEDTKE